jgi:heme/copper-type cytochrome/quinol oxidase subunit 2
MVRMTDYRASAADRTWVIILAQVVVIVALLVVWSIVRARRGCDAAPADRKESVL